MTASTKHRQHEVAAKIVVLIVGIVCLLLVRARFLRHAPTVSVPANLHLLDTKLTCDGCQPEPEYKLACKYCQ